MSLRFNQLFALPILSEDEQSGYDQLLRLLLLLILGGSGLYALAVVILTPEHLSRVWISGAMAAIVIASVPLLKRGKIPLAGLFISILMYCVFTFSALTAGGVRSPGFYGYLLSVTIAGLLVSGRAAVGMAVLGSVTGLALVFIERAGHLPEPMMVHTPGTTLLAGSVYLFLLAFGLYATRNTLQRITHRIREQEHELDQNKIQSEAILDAIPDMIFRISREGIFLEFRPARTLDPLVPPDEFIGKRQRDVLPPDIARESMRLVEKALSTGEPQRHEYSLSLDGMLHYYIAYLVPGGPDDVLGFVRDISDQKRVEAALVDSEKKYRQLVEMTQEGIWVIDKDARTSFVNPSMARMLGYAPEEMMGRPLFDFVDERGRIMAETNLARRREGIEEQHDVELICKDGTRIFTIMESAPLTDESGAYAGAIAGVVDQTRQRQAQDEIQKLNAELEERVANRTAELENTIRQLESEIKERLRTERALRLSEARYRAIVEDQTELICRFLPDGTITFVNEAYGRYFAQSPEAMMGSRFLPRIQEADRTLLTQKLSLLGCARPSASVEIRVITDDRGERWQRWNYRAICDDEGNVTEYQAVGADITRQREAEEAIRVLNDDLRDRAARLEAANRELQSFSGSVSHDLRAPLRAISGFSSILARRYRDQLDEDGQRYIDNVVEAGRQMDQLIEDLLSYARMGRQAVRYKSVAIHAILSRVLSLFDNTIRESGAVLTLPEADLTITTDPTLLHQILLNLVGNALVYHRPGERPHVEIALESNPREIEIHVRDKGIGIEAAHIDKIFKIFQRLHSQETYPGSGVGLALVKKAVEMLDGSIAVESIPDAGSTFTVRLPRH